MKSIVKKLRRYKKLVSCFALLLAAAAIFWTVSSPRIVGVSASSRKLPIYNVQKDEKVVSLTFDAAWGNEDTQQLIDTFEEYGVKATFFVVGEWVDKYPESVKALHDAGHEVMNHSNDHAHFNSLSAEQIKKNVNDCNDKVEAVTGVRPILFRPPYGEYNDNVVQSLTDIGMYTIQWDVDSLDWKDLSAQEIKTRVMNGVKNGSIVLFHNAAKNTPEALPLILQALQEQGYSAVPVSELIYKDNYEMDHTGMQCRRK